MAEEKTLEFRYSRAADYRRALVSGILGGPNPQGLIVAHTFFESHHFAEVQTGVVNKLGALIMPPEEPSGVINREIFATLLFQPHVARSVAQWLLGHAKSIEDSQKQGQNPS